MRPKRIEVFESAAGVPLYALVDMGRGRVERLEFDDTGGGEEGDPCPEYCAAHPRPFVGAVSVFRPSAAPHRYWVQIDRAQDRRGVWIPESYTPTAKTLTVHRLED